MEEEWRIVGSISCVLAVLMPFSDMVVSRPLVSVVVCSTASVILWYHYCEAVVHFCVHIVWSHASIVIAKTSRYIICCSHTYMQG